MNTTNLGTFVKRLRDIMRMDAGISGDAQRIGFAQVILLGKRQLLEIGLALHVGDIDALEFDRDKAMGFRLNILSGTAVRFEPGQAREVELVEFGGNKAVFGFAGRVMGQAKSSLDV